MVTYMTKPYTILKTLEEPGFGILVTFSISITKTLDNTGPQVHTLESGVLVPTGEDIDNYLTDYLTRSGWIEV